ncbi:MAG: PfkB family carbohydrate kinase [Promethearchaeota archaeon]|jgi:hypothetical protein
MSNRNKTDTSLIFIGHFAVDNIIKFERLSKPTLGGSVSYCSLALRAYTQSAKINIISHVGKLNFDMSLFTIIKNKNIDLKGIKYSDVKNTNFVLDYFNRARILTLKSKSPTLKFQDIPQKYLNHPPDILVLVPLCNEISYEYVLQISNHFPNLYIGIDLQGFIRNIDENGVVSYIHDEKIIKNLSKIIKLIGDKLILKGSEEEMKLLASEEKDNYNVMNFFEKFDSNGIFIMTLGEKGSLIYRKGNNILEIPAFKPKKVVDETGAGDVYFSIFLYEFLQTDKSWGNIEKIGYLASAAASFLVEKKGPAGFGVKKKVLKRVKKKHYFK